MLVVLDTSRETVIQYLSYNMPSPLLVLTISLLVPRVFAFDVHLSCAITDALAAVLLPPSLQQFYIENLRHRNCNSQPDTDPTEREAEFLFYHLGGNSPWISKRRDSVGDASSPPENCNVEQVHMLSRHAERYPTTSAGARHLSLLDRIASSPEPLNPVFSFLHNWTYFTSESNPSFELLTSTGQQAGTLEAFETGVKLRTRYQHLIPQDGTTTRFWTASASRDIATARYFADGFFGRDWEVQQLADLQIIPETSDLGGNTLTPGDTCLNYVTDKIDGHDKGYVAMAEWQEVFVAPIKERLEQGQSYLDFTPVEVFGMMEMCGFEMLVRDGISPWCNVFDHNDWQNFAYARDLLHFYRAGPGNRYSRAMGWLWLNATMNLLEQGPSAGTMFFSFVHDGDVIPMLAALGYPKGYDGPDSETALPTNRSVTDRAYKTSDITPMGGRIIFERLSCSTTTGNETFIRLNINDGVIPIGHDSSGPGNSTSMSDFKRYLDARAELAGDFRQVCGLDEAAPDSVTFLHQ